MTENNLGQHKGSSGAPLKSQTSIADSLNEGLRARRSGKSYDYLIGEGDENRHVPPGKFTYHGSAPRLASGKSYDYMGQDQNREGPPLPPTHSHPNPAARYEGHSSSGSGHRYTHSRDEFFLSSEDDDDEIDSADEEWVQQQMALRPPIPTAPAQGSGTGNPGPIGLLGFGMTTILLNLHNTGHWPLYSVVPSMGLCFGGGVQLIAGLLEFTKGNTFGCVAFSSFGAFWLSLVCIWMLPNASTGGPPGVAATSEYFLGVFLIIWGLFSAMMTFCAIRLNVAIFLVFLSVTLLFLLLGGANMAGNANAVKAAGYEGIVCGGLAMYLGFAEVVNEVWDRTLMPVIPMPQLLEWLGAGKDKEE